MEGHFNFIPLLLVLLLAFIVPMVVGRLRWLPVIVGEIAAGVIIGSSGLGLVGTNQTLEIFSTIGLAFLMFLAGMEIDFDRLLPARRARLVENRRNNAKKQEEKEPNILGMSALVYLLTLALAIPGGFILNWAGLEGNPWLLAFILSATSLGIVLPTIKQRNMTYTPTGQAIFFTALLADFITVILLTVFIITLERGLNLEILSVGLLFLVFFFFYGIADRFFRITWVRSLVEELSHVTVQIKVRGALAILMAFVVLAEVLGLELILGAFLAGMIISLMKSPEDIDLVHKMEAFGFGFFIPVFFILVGVNLQLGELLASPQSLLLLPVLLLVALAVKALPALLFRRYLTWRQTLATAFLLNSHLSLEIAVAVIGVRLGLLSPAANTAVILFAVLTVLFMPILFNTLMPADKSKDQGWMVVFGAEDLGLQVARILETHGERVRFLDPDKRLADKARRAGYNTIQANTIYAHLEEACQDGVKALLTLSSDDTRNLLVAKAAERYGVDHIVALVTDPNRLPEYRALDVHTFVPNLYRPPLLALMARSPDIFHLLTTTTDDQDVREVSLRNPLLSGERLRTLNLPGNLLVLSVGRNGELVVPHGNTRVELGDRLTILGNIQELEEAAGWLEQTNPV